LAKVKIGEIASGKDPAEDRRRRRQSITFGELEKMYLERHAVHKKSKSNDVGMFKKWLSDWRSRRLSTITRADITTRHAEMGAAGHTTWANRMVALVRTMFNLAFDWGVHPGPNPASRIKFFKEVKRDRFVRPDELPRLWKALQNEPNPYVRGAFFIGLLTGARRSEVLGMTWADLDLQQGLWRIPETKAGRSHTLPLPRPAIDELLKLPRLEGNPFVFCGRWGKKNLCNVSKPWRRIRKEAGLNDVRIHDLRRTLGSWLVAAGASLPLIGKALNHTQPATTAIYARLELDPVRVALESNAQRMLSVVSQENSDGQDTLS
ncbi:MAG: site-specific integrase, partial [Nitrospira sp.]|nr:site-specific integrase [Nitrospira sp.]